MTKPLSKIDVVLSIYNQEKLIERVLYGIFKNTTTPFNLILVFDGCTDRTEKRALRYIQKYKPKLLKNLIVDHAANVFETRANNIGFKKAQEEYMVTLQDDMVINEFGWEKRLTYPLRKFDDIIAVSSRIAQDLNPKIEDRDPLFINKTGREFGNLPRNIFAVRGSINRGPVAFNVKHLKSMNYLNDNYAPSDLDDADLCLRSWKEKKLRCGAYWIDYISKIEWGKARAKDSTMLSTGTISRNTVRIRNDNREYILSNQKHNQDIVINESEIDYDPNISSSLIKTILTFPIRFNFKKIWENITQYIIKVLRKLIYSIFKIIGIKNPEKLGVKRSIQLLLK